MRSLIAFLLLCSVAIADGPSIVGPKSDTADGIDESEADSVKAWLLELMEEHGTSVPLGLRTWAASAVVYLLQKGTAVVLE